MGGAIGGRVGGVVRSSHFRTFITDGSDMRIRTLLAAGGMAVAVVAGSAGVAAAEPGHSGTRTHNGNGSVQAYGNTHTGGVESPQIGLVQGSLNKPCVAVAGKANVGSLIGLIPITVQDVNVLSSPQNQQCAENSTQAKRDEPLSHILSDIPILSGNGNSHGRGGDRGGFGGFGRGRR
jgi:hypothetical protein